MSDKYYSSVVFLAGFEGSDGATSYNEEKNGRAATFAGNAHIAQDQKKWGSTSAAFDGNGDKITFADNADWTLAGDFTVEAWIYPVANPAGNQCIVAHYSATSNQRGWQLVRTSSSGLSFDWSTNGSGLTGSGFGGVLTAINQWHHIAVCRQSATAYKFVNGVLVDTASMSGALFNSTAALSIGAVQTGSGADYFNGYIDEVRITNVARWTTSFPLPQGPWSRAKRTGVSAKHRQPIVNRYRA